MTVGQTGDKAAMSETLAALIGRVAGRSGSVLSTARNIEHKFFGGGCGAEGCFGPEGEPAGLINSAEANLRSILSDLSAIERFLMEMEQRIA